MKPAELAVACLNISSMNFKALKHLFSKENSDLYQNLPHVFRRCVRIIFIHIEGQTGKITGT